MINETKIDIYSNQLLSIGASQGFSTGGLAAMKKKLREVVADFLNAAPATPAVTSVLAEPDETLESPPKPVARKLVAKKPV